MRDQWIEWFQDKQRRFFYGVVAVIAIIFVAFQVADMVRKKNKRQYAFAMHQFESWLLKGGAFDELETALQRDPALQTKLGAKVADRFISQNRGEKAELFAEDVLKRARVDTPHHAIYAEGSLLISKGDLRGALKKTVSLKETLPSDSLLYGFTLVRLASLYRALDASNQEQGALLELESFLQQGSESAKHLSGCFHYEGATLGDYILHRKAK